MRTSRIVWIAVSGTMALALTACGSGASSDDGGSSDGAKKISIGYYPGLSTSYMSMVAKDQGIFKKNGLNVELVQITSGPQQISALLGGSLTIADLPAPSIVPLMQKNQGAIKVLTGGENFTYQLVGQPGLESADTKAGFPGTVKAIKGKTVGIIQAGGTIDYFVRGLAKSAGLDPAKDYTLVGSGSAAANVAGFRAKKYDVTVAFPEQLSQLGTEGTDYVKLADSLNPETTNHLYDDSLESVLGTKSDWIDDNPDLAKQFCTSMIQARDFIVDPANEDALKSDLQAEFQQSPDAVWPILKQSKFSPVLTEDIWNKQASTAGVGAMPSFKDYVSPVCAGVAGG